MSLASSLQPHSHRFPFRPSWLSVRSLEFSLLSAASRSTRKLLPLLEMLPPSATWWTPEVLAQTSLLRWSCLSQRCLVSGDRNPVKGSQMKTFTEMKEQATPWTFPSKAVNMARIWGVNRTSGAEGAYPVLPSLLPVSAPFFWFAKWCFGFSTLCPFGSEAMWISMQQTSFPNFKFPGRFGLALVSQGAS